MVTVNDLPAVGGLGGTLTGPDNQPFAPFLATTVADLDTTTATVTVDFNDANGTLIPGAGGAVAGGTFSFAGTPAAAEAALRGLVFYPVLNLAALGAGVATTFALTPRRSPRWTRRLWTRTPAR